MVTKATLYDIKGKKRSELALPKALATKVRPDIVHKYLEAEKFVIMHPYSPDPKAGKKHSASGTISHKRHDWKGHYGRGISRIPRKTMWRRGTNFFWIGAEISSTRGGRRAHEPKLFKRIRKINKKEIMLAMNSALAATTDPRHIIERYSSLDKFDIKGPIVIESKLDNVKAKDLLAAIKNILPSMEKIIERNKEVRAGRGKMRGRKYKSNAGLLLIKAKDEKIKNKIIEVISLEDLTIADLYPLGRLTIFTEKAIKALDNEKVKEAKK